MLREGQLSQKKFFWPISKSEFAPHGKFFQFWPKISDFFAILLIFGQILAISVPFSLIFWSKFYLGLP